MHFLIQGAVASTVSNSLLSTTLLQPSTEYAICEQNLNELDLSLKI